MVPPHHRKASTGETPFMLAYGSEPIPPVEVTLYTHRLTTFQEELNNEALQEALNFLPSICGNALLQEALYKLCIARLYNRVVQLHLITTGDLVFRRMEVIACAGKHDKLTANWEGPYRVVAQVCPKHITSRPLVALPYHEPGIAAT